MITKDEIKKLQEYHEAKRVAEAKKRVKQEKRAAIYRIKEALKSVRSKGCAHVREYDMNELGQGDVVARFLRMKGLSVTRRMRICMGGNAWNTTKFIEYTIELPKEGE